MNVIDRILIAIDDECDEIKTLDYGLAMASSMQANVFITAVYKNVDDYSDTLEGVMSKEQFTELFIKHHTDRIQKIVDENSNKDVEVTIEVIVGMPFIEIIKKSISVDADIIFQVSHSDSETSHYFTSEDWRLIRKSLVPVWILNQNQTNYPKRILAAVDVSNSAESKSINKHILSLAFTIAEKTGAHLTILSAWHLMGENMMRHSAFIKVDSVELNDKLKEREDHIKENQLLLKSSLEGKHELSDNDVDWKVVNGNPRDVIPKFSDKNNIDLIVMGTLNRTGISGLLIGNTAENILSEVKCSVLTVKPALFKSPVLDD